MLGVLGNGLAQELLVALRQVEPLGLVFLILVLVRVLVFVIFVDGAVPIDLVLKIEAGPRDAVPPEEIALLIGLEG